MLNTNVMNPLLDDLESVLSDDGTQQDKNLEKGDFSELEDNNCIQQVRHYFPKVLENTALATIFSIISGFIPATINNIMFDEWIKKRTDVVLYLTALTVPLSFELFKWLFNMSTRGYDRVYILSEGEPDIKFDDYHRTQIYIRYEDEDTIKITCRNNGAIVERMFTRQEQSKIFNWLPKRDDHGLMRGPKGLLKAIGETQCGINPLAGPKKHFYLYLRFSSLLMITLEIQAAILSAYQVGKDWDTFDRAALIMVPGIFLMFFNYFIAAPYVFSHRHYNPSFDFLYTYLFKASARNKNHANNWYNFPMHYITEYILPVCALIGGGILFGKMHIHGTEMTVGGALIEFFMLCGARSAVSIYTAAVQFNIIIGVTLFLLAKAFSGVYPNYLSLLSTGVALVAVFEGLASLSPFLKEENLWVKLIAGTVTFAVNYIVQSTIVPKAKECLTQCRSRFYFEEKAYERLGNGDNQKKDSQQRSGQVNNLIASPLRNQNVLIGGNTDISQSPTADDGFPSPDF